MLRWNLSSGCYGDIFLSIASLSYKDTDCIPYDGAEELELIL